MSRSTGWVIINREAEFHEGFEGKGEAEEEGEVCDEEEEVVEKDKRLKRVWRWEMGGRRREGLERGMAGDITVEKIVPDVFEIWWEDLSGKE